MLYVNLDWSSGAGMRVFKSKQFARFAAQEDIHDALLCDAIKRASDGLIDADLGGGVIKQRLAREGQGRSGGHRSIILFKKAERAIFAYGFAKNARDNIGQSELRTFRKLADVMLTLDSNAIQAAINNGTVVEIMCHG